MQNVITLEQAKKITGGRTPLVPVEYEKALAALESCVHIDEAKYWSDKADALAAWAKIYRSNDAQRKAAALKLYAYRRMGEIAQELRPRKKFYPGRGSHGGPHSLLIEAGLTPSQATQARRCAIETSEGFRKQIEKDHPPSPSQFVALTGGGTTAYRGFQNGGAPGARSYMRKNAARDVARAVDADEARIIALLGREITQWFDEFEACMPKVVE